MVESNENPLVNKATSQKSIEQEPNPYNQKKDYLDYDKMEKAKQSSFADANTLLGQKVNQKVVVDSLQNLDDEQEVVEEKIEVEQVPAEDKTYENEKQVKLDKAPQEKDELKELAIKYRNPITGETINISNALAREIFLKSDEAKNDYLDYEMLITVESADMNPNTRSRNNKFINSGGGFEFWESIRCFENDVINYISDISFRTNEKENDKGVHPLFALENNDDINKEDKGLVLKNAKDKNASFFENACYLYNDGMSAVQKLSLIHI